MSARLTIVPSLRPPRDAVVTEVPRAFEPATPIYFDLPMASRRLTYWSFGSRSEFSVPGVVAEGSTLCLEVAFRPGERASPRSTIVSWGAWGAALRLESRLGKHRLIASVARLDPQAPADQSRPIEVRAKGFLPRAWTTAALTVDATETLHLFVEGVPAGSASLAGTRPVLDPRAGLQLGGRGRGQERFVGDIAGVALWDVPPAKYRVVSRSPLRVLTASPELVAQSVKRHLAGPDAIDAAQVIWQEEDESVTLHVQALAVKLLPGWVVVDLPLGRDPGVARLAYRVGDSPQTATLKFQSTRQADAKATGLCERWAPTLERAVYDGLLNAADVLLAQQAKLEREVRVVAVSGVHCDAAGLHFNTIVEPRGEA